MVMALFSVGAAAVAAVAAVAVVAAAAVAAAGDYEGLGATRREELFAAAAALGVSKDNVCCLNDKNMRDGWQQWSSKAVCNAVRGFLKSKQQQIHCVRRHAKFACRTNKQNKRRKECR